MAYSLLTGRCQFVGCWWKSPSTSYFAELFIWFFRERCQDLSSTPTITSPNHSNFDNPEVCFKICWYLIANTSFDIADSRWISSFSFPWWETSHSSMSRGQMNYELYLIVLYQNVDQTKVVWSAPLICCVLPEKRYFDTGYAIYLLLTFWALALPRSDLLRQRANT